MIALKDGSISIIRLSTSAHSRVLWQCAVALVVTLPAALPGQENLVRSIENARKTVAPVVCLVRDANTGIQGVRFRILGTAFIVESSGTFITARHVISAFKEEGWRDACSAAITFPVGGWKRAAQDVRWFTFDLATCRVNDVTDVAICKTQQDISAEKSLSFTVAAISPDKPSDGTEVFFVGFPLQATDPISSVGYVAGFTAGSGYDEMLVDKNAWPGASGSPIYLRDGKTVVGMITKTGTGESAGLSFGIVGTKIAAVFADAKVKWSEKQSSPEEH